MVPQRAVRERSGFTLVELITVVAIIGVLMSIAIPLYQNYVIRTRITEAVLALSQCRESVSEIYQFSDAGTVVGADNWDCGENTAKSQFVSTVNTDLNGTVVVTLRNIDVKVNTKTLSMIPQHDGSPAVIADIPAHVNGFECVPGGGNPVDGTYVPRECR